MEVSGNRGATVVRKGGWKGFSRVLYRKIRSETPKYRLVVLLSIVLDIASSLFRLATRRNAVEYLRVFRSELKDFVAHRERVYDTPVEAFMIQLRGWEERMSPEQAVESIRAKLNDLGDDLRISELHFALSNAYYLAGEYRMHEDYVRHGLEHLQRLRRGSDLDKLGVKFLFTEDWGWGIGHCTHLDPLVKLRELGLLSAHERVIVVSPGDGANKHYLRYWNKHLRFLTLSRHEARQLRAFTQPISEKLFGFELRDRCVPLYEACNIAGANWHQQKRPPLLALTPEDSARGRETLSKWGLPPDAWFVTLHVREFNPYAPNHLRVRAAPNADVRTYFPAIEAITRRGGWVIRIGDPSMSELPETQGVIDYANSPDRVDWMDVFLCAACKFYIGTSSGPVTLPPTFGVPVLYTNALAIGVSHDLGRALVLPKLFFSTLDKRLLSLEEILASPVGWTVRIPEGRGLEIRDNTADEIKEGVIEMFERLNSGAEGFSDRSQLQRRFDELRIKYGGGGGASTPMAQSFAKRHRGLLGAEGGR